MAILLENLTTYPNQKVRIRIPNREGEFVIISFRWLPDLEYWMVGYEWAYKVRGEDKVRKGNGYYLSLSKGLFGDRSLPFDLFVKDSGVDVGGRLVTDLESGRVKVYLATHEEIDTFLEGIRTKYEDDTIELGRLKQLAGGYGTLAEGIYVGDADLSKKYNEERIRTAGLANALAQSIDVDRYVETELGKV